MNLGTKYNHRVTLRLNDEQYDFIIKISNVLGVSPSDYMRMSLNSMMVASGSNIDKIISGDAVKEMVGTDENVKTDSNDKL